MVDQLILEGLKLALHKGQTLKEAMMSFYNAGYTKQAIEAAARELHSHGEHPEVSSHEPTRPTQPKQEFKPLARPSASLEKNLEGVPEKHGRLPLLFRNKQKSFDAVRGMRAHPAMKNPVQQVQQIQKTPIHKEVSSYSTPQKKAKNKLTLIILILVFLVLLGVFAAIFLFKEEVLELFNMLFG